MNFETERLKMRLLEWSDADKYFDMMGNPNVMEPVPVKTMNKEESDNHLKGLMKLDPEGIKKVWAVELKDVDTFIGLVAIIENDELDEEIGYRFRESYWGVGYGTESAIGLLRHGFNVLGLEKMAADANTANPGSMKILDKFFTRVRTFENKEGNCIDQRFILYKKDWLEIEKGL